jgi:DNA-binding NtrC family response regulator
MLYVNPSVLVVEDNEQLSALFSKVFSQIGLRTSRTASVLDTLDYLTTNVPDMVMLDMTMGDGNSTVIIDYMKSNSRFSETEIVVATGDTKYQAYAEEHGVEHFFQKPISVRMLITFTRRLLGNRLPTAQLVDLSSYV